MAQEAPDRLQAPPSSLRALDLPLPRPTLPVPGVLQNPSTMEICKMEMFWKMKATLAGLPKSGVKQMMDNDTLQNWVKLLTSVKALVMMQYYSKRI